MRPQLTESSFLQLSVAAGGQDSTTDIRLHHAVRLDKLLLWTDLGPFTRLLFGVETGEVKPDKPKCI